MEKKMKVILIIFAGICFIAVMIIGLMVGDKNEEL